MRLIDYKIMGVWGYGLVRAWNYRETQLLGLLGFDHLGFQRTLSNTIYDSL